MKNLIRADFWRILRKPSFYILNFLTLLALAVTNNMESAAEQLDSIKSLMDLLSLLILGITVFLCVYGDEIKSGRLVSVIGSGISRRKLILAKLNEVGILFVWYFAIAFGIAVAKNAYAGIGVTPKQSLFLLLYLFYLILKGIGYFAVASLVVFLTWNTAAGMIILVSAIMISEPLFRVAQQELVLPFYDISFQGLLTASYTAFSAGTVGWQVVPAVVVYICGITVLSIYLFNKKEIEL